MCIYIFNHSVPLLSSPLLQGASGQRAKVYIDGVLKAESDADGKYELSDMSTGKCRVTVSMVMSVTKACTYIHTYIRTSYRFTYWKKLVTLLQKIMHCMYICMSNIMYIMCVCE